LPLFIAMVRTMAERDPARAKSALDGLHRYQQAVFDPCPPVRPVAAQVGPACLRASGGNGPPLVLVPSLINPPDVLDLDAEASLAGALAGFGRTVLLLDWGPADARASLDVAGHVEQLLVPLLAGLDEPAALVGYCLGGTMALAAANIVPVERVATLAAPWSFVGYPRAARDGLAQLWQRARHSAETLGMLPLEVLQAAFWGMDPERTVGKFAHFAQFDQDAPEARRFVALEHWANQGEPLPFPAARELIEDLFGADLPGRGQWRVAGRTVTAELPVPALHLLASNDRIVPAESAPPGPSLSLPAGHVGMVVGSARSQLHAALAEFVRPAMLAAPAGGG
jgi:polyhydroxyalkanoate synthase subunit PhaC